MAKRLTMETTGIKYENKLAILRYLADRIRDDGVVFCSCRDLCGRFGLSHAMANRHIQHLRHEGWITWEWIGGSGKPVIRAGRKLQAGGFV